MPRPQRKLKPEPEVVARRQTSDGKTVKFWSDGAVTSWMNTYVGGGRLPQNMLWTVADDVSLFDWAELPCVIRTAKRLGKRKKPVLPGDFRREAHRACTR